MTAGRTSTIDTQTAGTLPDLSSAHATKSEVATNPAGEAADPIDWYCREREVLSEFDGRIDKHFGHGGSFSHYRRQDSAGNVWVNIANYCIDCHQVVSYASVPKEIMLFYALDELREELTHGSPADTALVRKLLRRMLQEPSSQPEEKDAGAAESIQVGESAGTERSEGKP